MRDVSKIIGSHISNIQTPALLVDWLALNNNLKSVARYVSERNLKIRPHAKAHKCVQIAKMQIELGATGICCQTVREVEQFAEMGIPDILLTNQVTDLNKAIRVVSVARSHSNQSIGICVDSVEQIRLFNRAISQSECSLNVYIEIDVGGKRCGVDSIQAFDELIFELSQASGLRLAGLQAYNGKVQHTRYLQRRANLVEDSNAITKQFADYLEERIQREFVITGGGTGTLEIDSNKRILSEIQCGSYALMDKDYSEIEYQSLELDNALFVLSRVLSHRPNSHTVLDAGLKALSFDSGLPAVCSHPELDYSNPSDEHGILSSISASALPMTGELVKLIPCHCDPTVALHSNLFVVENDIVIDVWPTIARGEW